MKFRIILRLSRPFRLLLITGALAFALHTQVPLARGGECDDDINPDLFQDNGWNPDAPENKDKKKPPHELITAKCGCEDLFAALQKALNKCYDAEKAKADADKEKEKADNAKADADKAKADADKAAKDADKAAKDAAKDKTKTAKDKADATKAAKDAKADAAKAKTDADKAAKDAAKAKTDADKAAKDAKDAKEKADKANDKADKADKAMEDAKKDVEKKWAELQDKLDVCKNYTGPKRQPLKPGEVRLKGLKSPGGGDVILPPIPDKPNCKNLDDVEQELLKLRKELMGHGDISGEQSAKEAAAKQVNDRLKEVGDLKAKLDCPKEQKSMLPPPPGQELKSMAPGQPPPADETSGDSKLETTTSPGVVTKTVSVMDNGELVGEVIANFPDDPTGTFTGTVETKPAGKTDEERARNQTKLNDVVIKVGDQQTKPSERTFTCVIPAAAPKQPLGVVVLFKDEPVVKTSVPVSKTTPQPTTDQLPWFGQTGRNLVIPHSCDGKVDPTDSVKIGGQTLPLIVETQRMRVVRDVSNVTGPTQVEFSEQGQVTRAPVQNMSVQLSAKKSRLKPNEKTTLKMNVSGMRDITKPVGLEIVNNSAGIVGLRGGNTQHLVVQPSEVGPGGTCTKTFTLTGKTPGGFNIKATLENSRKSDTHP